MNKCKKCDYTEYLKASRTAAGSVRVRCKKCHSVYTPDPKTKPRVSGISCPDCKSEAHIQRAGHQFKCMNIPHHINRRPRWFRVAEK